MSRDTTTSPRGRAGQQPYVDGAEPRLAKRLQAPGWRDPRLIVGVILVLLAVAGGARVVSSMDQADPVYAAARALLPGQEVGSGDVTVVDVRLGPAAAQYVSAASPLEPGTHVVRPVAAGELIPLSALGDRSAATDKTVSVTIDSATADTLTAGTVVDLWVSRRDAGGAGTSYLEPELLIESAVVAQAPEGRSALGGSFARSPVQIVVPEQDVSAVIAAVDQEGRLTLVPAPTGRP